MTASARRVVRHRTLISVTAVVLIGGIAATIYLLTAQSTSQSSATQTWSNGVFAVQVPASWTSKETQLGDGSVVTYTNPAGDETAEIAFSRCTNCMADLRSGTIGARSVKNVMPTAAISPTPMSTYEYRYAMPDGFGVEANGNARSAALGYEYQAAVLANQNLTFYVQIDVTVRLADDSTATAILNSARQSGTP